MTGVKGLFQSRTVWAGLIIIVANVLHMFGFTVGAEDQELITSSVLSIVDIIFGGIAVWGRIAASKRISLSG